MVMQIEQFYMCISLTNVEDKTSNHAMTVTYIASMMDLYRDQGAAMTVTYIANMIDLYRDQGTAMTLPYIASMTNLY